ncbi:MAG: PrsW family glutamic-type intramembrane protease [Paludibacteraceae bacterium]|nr:PrsW family glutamic-type intramembrane protease [Paludibacteraceae bacterium]
MTLLVAALLPAFLLIFYICYKDRIQAEPTRLLVRGFVYGVVSCLPASFLEVMFSGVFAGSAASEALSPALIEEICKFFFIYLLVRNNPYFDEHFDGIVYAVCVGVGFEATENLLYFINDPSCITARTLLPGHFLFAVLMGYYLSRAKFTTGNTRRKNALLMLLVPVAAHWFWDFLCFYMAQHPEAEGGMLLVFIAFVITLWRMVHKAIIKQQNRDAEMATQKQAKQTIDYWQQLRF